MLLRQIALVPEAESINLGEVSKVAAALQKQAIRDVGPIWDIQATVDTFATLEDVPIGYWPIVVMDDINTPGAAGVHEDKDGQPFALVQFDIGWSLTASHEMVEMLVDPFGNRLASGQSPKNGQGRVEFLVEPCDPSEAAEFAYTINGITVSDFYTPKYFMAKKVPGDRYSYTGDIKEPRQVLKGGYLSWHNPVDDHWYQEIYFNAKPQFRDLGVFTANAGKSFRRQIYDATPKAFQARVPNKTQLTATSSLMSAIENSAGSKAAMWRQQIKSLLSGNAAAATGGN